MEDVTRLVSIDDAKRHVRETSTVAATEAEVEAKLAAATAFVVRMCGALADEDWDEATVPGPVHTAILLHLSELFADRGDDSGRAKPFGDDAVRYLIATGYRDTVVA
jgi:hypothetical protein